MNTATHPEIIGLDVSRDWLDIHCLSDDRRLRLPNTDEGHSKLEEIAAGREALVCFEATGRPRMASLGEPGGGGGRSAAARSGASESLREKPGHFGQDGPDRRRTDRPVHGVPPGCRAEGCGIPGRRRPSASSSSRCAKARGSRPKRICGTARPSRSRTCPASFSSCWSARSLRWKRGSGAFSRTKPSWPRPPPSCSRFRGSARWFARCRSRRCPSSAGSPGEQAAALAGLAPVARDSGQMRGKRMIGGGRRALRCVLHQAALVASIHNKDLKLFADRLRKEGKPHKVVAAAVARKLVVIANALCKSRQPWAAQSG